MMLSDMCYILSSYIEVINYNLYEDKKKKIKKHKFDKYSLNEKESLKLFYLLKRGI